MAKQHSSIRHDERKTLAHNDALGQTEQEAKEKHKEEDEEEG